MSKIFFPELIVSDEFELISFYWKANLNWLRLSFMKLKPISLFNTMKESYFQISCTLIKKIFSDEVTIHKNEALLLRPNRKQAQKNINFVGWKMVRVMNWWYWLKLYRQLLILCVPIMEQLCFYGKFSMDITR